MNNDRPAPGTIDEYIAGFPLDIREKLESIRATIVKAAPEAEEAIKYGMPTFILHGNLVHFAAFKKHIGFYPIPVGVEEFKDDLAPYEAEKSTARFPLDAPVPLALIRRIVKYRVKKNLDKGKK